jgi:glucokinase
MRQAREAILPVAIRERLGGHLRASDPVPDADLAEDWLDRDGRFLAVAGGLFGADVGGTKVQSVVTDLNGTVLAEMRADTPAAGGHAVLALVAAHMAELSAQAGCTILAAGIGLPGALHPVTGHLERAPNLRGLAGRDMREVFRTELGVPVAVENDVNLAAIGEAWLGLGARVDTRVGGLAFVALGTGIGMGVAWGDRVLRGALGAAGEIAALPIGADPFAASSHTCGALESVVSGAALVAAYRASGGTHSGQTLRDIAKDASPDPALDAVMDRLAKHAAQAVLSVDAVLNPSLFVFGGGIGSRPALLERVRSYLERLVPEGMPVPECHISILGNRAGVLGAIRTARLAYADRLLE